MKYILVLFDNYLETRPLGLFTNEVEAQKAVSQAAKYDDGVYITYEITLGAAFGTKKLSEIPYAGGEFADLSPSDPDQEWEDIAWDDEDVEDED